MYSPRSEPSLDFSTPPKVTRSFSVSSSGSSSPSAYSRSADDMLDRLAALHSTATVHLWSAGNVRFNGRDLTIPSHDAAELIAAMKADERFEVTSVVHLDGNEDCKITFRRIDSASTTPSQNNGERCPAI